MSTPDDKSRTSRDTIVPIARGEVRNPSGRNSYTIARAKMRSYMLDHDKSVPGTTRKRFDALLEATYENAINGGKDGAVDRKLLWSYIVGKEPKAPEDARLDLAEHLRKVETDRFAFAVQLIGAARLAAMSDKEKAEWFNSLVVAQHDSVEMFLKMAAEQTQSREHDQEPDELAPVPDPGAKP